jgi:uncharacterized membrane protein
VAYLADWYAGGDLYRFNTVFKLYEQAWPLFAISSAVALGAMVQAPRFALRRRVRPYAPATAAMGIVATPARPFVDRERVQTPQRAFPTRLLWRLWLAMLGLLLCAAALYPVLETPLHLAERSAAGYWIAAGNPPLGPTLDGTAFVRKAFPAEYQALSWLNGHVTGDPTVLSSDRGFYDNFAFRVPWMTGLPNVVQGNWEEAQQRYNGQQGPSGPYPTEIDDRHGDVQTIFSTADAELALSLLHKYHVSYVYVGIAERGQPGPNPPSGCFTYGSSANASCLGYPPAGLAKFGTMAASGALRVVYKRGGVTIYKVVG